jgi:hypothetical protein
MPLGNRRFSPAISCFRIGLPGKAAFANMTPIKGFRPKWHILSIAEANWIERGGAKPIAI